MGALLLFLAALFWGATFVAQKLGADSLGPFTVVFLRSLIAGVCLLAFSFRKFGRRELIAGFVCGASLFLASLTQQIGIADTTPGVSAFLTSNYVLMVPVFALFIGRRPHPVVWVGAVLALVGSLFICFESLEELRHLSLGRGEAWTLLCAALFSLQIMLVDKFAHEVDIVAFSSAQQFSGALFAMPFLLLPAERAAHSLANFKAAALPVLFMAIVSSGLAYTCQNLGQKRTKPALASIIMCLESVFGAVFGWLWFGDVMSSHQLVGCSLVFLAALITPIAVDLLMKGKG